MSAICIIIPVYNAEKYIARCLDSVLRQTFTDYEVILVNDGSTDASYAMCEDYCCRDSRFRILNKRNGGAASARNLGLDWYYRNSNSNWLSFLDIDDFIHERYLELLLAAALDTQTSISMCAYTKTDRSELQPIPELPEAVSFRAEELWCAEQVFCTVPVIKLFARSLFSNVRFPEGIIHEDEFTLYKVLFQCERIAFLDVPLYGYYQTDVSVMRGAWTPRHMTEPDGLKTQLQFFLDNGYQKASTYTARIYLLSLYNQLQRCKAAGAQYAEYAAKLKKRLHSELLHYRTLSGMKIENEPWLFYEAFPVRTIPYRIKQRIKNKKD